MSTSILITGIGGPAGASAFKYLKEAGFSHVIGTDARETRNNAYRFYLVPRALNPVYPETLLNIIRKERPALFIPTVTEELVVVAGLNNEIKREGTAVFISGVREVEIANDKLKTAEFMGSRGVPVPRTYDGTVDKEAVLNEIGLPVLVKPKFSRGGRGVEVYAEAAGLLADRRKEAVVQEFVPGQGFDLNLFIDGEGVLRSSVLLKKRRVDKGPEGRAFEVERVEDGFEKVTDVGVRAAESLSLTGPLNFDVRLKADGSPVLLEINARVGPNIFYAGEVLDSLIDCWKKECGDKCAL